MLRKSFPAINGAARMHHKLKCERYSVVVIPPLPTSSMSGSFQCPGPAKLSSPTCKSKIFTIPSSQQFPSGHFFMLDHLSVMSPVVRHWLPMSFAHSRGFAVPHSHMLKRIGRPVAFGASGTIFPSPSRLTCQQSSITTYSYPASFIPLVTIPSAIDLIKSSLTLQPNLFQLFHPIGGVSATPLSQACASVAAKRTAARHAIKHGARWRRLEVVIAFPQKAKMRRDVRSPCRSTANLVYSEYANELCAFHWGAVFGDSFLGGTVEDDAHFFKCDQSAFHHFIQLRKNLFDALRGFDNFHNDWQILREAENLVRVVNAR